MEERKLVPGDLFVKAADYEARCWVQGKKLYRFKDGSERWEPIVANFHTRFREIPLVRQAIAEGWDRELRGHIVPLVRKHVMLGGDVSSLLISELMPPVKWVEYARDQARRANEAKEWRDRIIDQYGSMEAYLTKTASRRTSSAVPVAGAAKQVIAELTERSRAMVGDTGQ